MDGVVSKETDTAVRSILYQRGMKKGDLSRFIEEAVKRRVFDQTLAEARAIFADVAPDVLQKILTRQYLARVATQQKPDNFCDW